MIDIAKIEVSNKTFKKIASMVLGIEYGNVNELNQFAISRIKDLNEVKIHNRFFNDIACKMLNLNVNDIQQINKIIFKRCNNGKIEISSIKET